jgi:hypothetical protein
VNIQTGVFRDVMPCNLVDDYDFLRYVTIKNEAEDSSETFLTIYQAARRHITEDLSLEMLIS